MALPPALFWLEWVKKTIWDPFWWVIIFLFILWVPFLRVWWWFFLPLMLQSQLKTLYLWWIDWDFDYAKAKWVVLEMIPPREILIPLKAMEDVFAVVWPLMDTGNFRERWCDGELDNGPYWFSWELASIEGSVHYYLRCLAGHRATFEMALYSHYPDLEIKEVSDYVRLVPPTVPNDEWDMYGEDWDFRGGKADAYPIKTYEKFFEPQGERISAEEKRIDPIIGLLEGMSKLGPGEHYWVQFITVPVGDHDEPGWKKEGLKVINKLAKRPEKKIPTWLEHIIYVFLQLMTGPQNSGTSDKPKYEWKPLVENDETGEKEMSVTPGEREIITEIEKKISKPVFRTTIRGVYIARREKWKAPNRILLRSYTAHFATNNLNNLGFQGATRPRIHYFMRKRRVFLRARKMFRNAVNRFPPLFPKRMSSDLNPILSTEEMATLYHFPLRVSGMVSPSMASIESKKAGPPPNLPISE